MIKFSTINKKKNISNNDFIAFIAGWANLINFE